MRPTLTASNRLALVERPGALLLRLLAPALLGACVSSGSQPPPSERLAITNVTLIDGKGGAPGRDMVVVGCAWTRPTPTR